MIPLTIAACALNACTPKATDDTSNPTDGAADTGTDTGIETGSDSDTGSDTGSDSDSDSDTGTTASGGSMVRIPAGTFTMGGSAGDRSDSYEDHQVTLTHDFWIGATEVTRGQWESFSYNAGWAYSSMPDYPCTTSTTASDCPADTVSWYDAAKYANALSTTEGLTSCYLADGADLAAVFLADPYSCPGYRLPTEAEWEYAARAGEGTAYSGSNTSTDVAWTSKNAYSVGTYAHQVATMAPNAWGLYDMSGNVWEWTNDWYDSAHGGYGDGGSDVDPAGPVTESGEGNEGSYRVVRGGGWDADAYLATVASRNSVSPDESPSDLGFRLARSIVP